MSYKRKRSYARPNTAKKSKYAPKPRRRFTAKGRSAIARIARRVIYRQMETKNVYVDGGKLELNHNVPQVAFHFTNSNYFPSQGTNDKQRIGDKIMLSGFRVRALFGQKADRPNVNWKVWLLEVNPGDVYSYSSWFQNVTGNALLDDINKDRCKVLKTWNFKPNRDVSSGTGGDEFTFVRKFWIPYRKKVPFATDGDTSPNLPKNLYMIACAYDAYGTLVTDNIAYIDRYANTYFKDP